MKYDGRTKHPLYRCWYTMLERCKPDGHKDYGARGIRVCDRWQNFWAFVEDMGLKPSPAHSIDRIDPNGNYEPENCRWATWRQQGEHTRRTRTVELNGETMHASEAARRTGLTSRAILHRAERGIPLDAPKSGVTPAARNANLRSRSERRQLGYRA